MVTTAQAGPPCADWTAYIDPVMGSDMKAFLRSEKQVAGHRRWLYPCAFPRRKDLLRSYEVDPPSLLEIFGY